MAGTTALYWFLWIPETRNLPLSPGMTLADTASFPLPFTRSRATSSFFLGEHSSNSPVGLAHTDITLRWTPGDFEEMQVLIPQVWERPGICIFDKLLRGADGAGVLSRLLSGEHLWESSILS